MLIAFERDEDGLLLPVVFRPGKPRVNLFRIRRLLNSPDRTSIEEILEKQANHQILTYAIDLQIREFATQHDGISSEQTIRKVWDMFTGLGLQVTNEENNDVVAQQYSLISHLCYEKPTVGTDKQKKMAEEKIKSEKLAILGSLGQGSYTEANVTKDFTMAELIATITPSTMEEIVGLSKHTLQVHQFEFFVVFNFYRQSMYFFFFVCMHRLFVTNIPVPMHVRSKWWRLPRWILF